jgi:phage tail P2-like protein
MSILLAGASNLSLPTAVDSSYPMTFAAWVNQSANAADQAVIAISVSGSVNMFMLDVNAGTPRASVKFQNTFVPAVSSGGAITLGTWYHLVAVFASATSRIIYVNGLNKGSNAVSGTPTGVNSTLIGSLVGNTFFRGSIAFPAIWNLALTQADVTALYNSGAGRDPRIAQRPAMTSMVLLDAPTPYTDLILPSTIWTQTGANSIAADPFSLGAPTLLTPFATAVGINNATLNGSIATDGGSPSTVTGFNYGTTAAYGSQVSTTQDIDLGTFANSLSGLLTTTYHFQAFATNSFGTGVSVDATFQATFSSTGGTPTTPSVVPVTPVPVGQFPIEGPDIGTSLTIWNASLLDYCNPSVKKDQAFVAICQALDPQLKAFLAEITNVIILSNISNQPENVLDFLALYHFNVDYYDTTLPKATKLLLIQNVIQDKISKGTPQRIIDLINDVFAFGELIEWFNDNPIGIPNTFRVQIADPLTDPVKVANLFRAILVAKNVRSYFAGISSFQSASFQNSVEAGMTQYDYQIIAWPRQ